MINLTRLSIAIACIGASSALLAEQDVSETRTVDADAYISVSNAVGEIKISGWNKNEVSIEGSLADNVEELLIEGGGDHLLVEVKNPRHSRRLQDTYLTIHVPHGVSVEVESISADIYVEALTGAEMSVETVSGDVEVEVDSESVDVESVSGDVDYRGGASETHAESVSGEITISGVSGELAVGTVSGDIDVEAEELSEGQFETVSGQLTISASLSRDARLSVETLSGDVILTLPDTVSARFEASSFSGDIESQFGRVISSGPGSELEFSVGDGSARVRLESFSADIEINSN